MNRFIRPLLAGLLVLATCVPLAAHAASDWSKSKKLAFDTTPKGAGLEAAVAQLPVLVRLHSGNFVFADAKPDGSDLRFFAADNKTPLKYYVERYDVANELAVVWVQVPMLATNAKTDAIWMHWGNPKAEAAEDRKGTYDASQILVFNFSDKEGVKDATANANDARESGAKPLSAGPIGAAVQMDGAGKVVVPASATLKLSAADGWTYTGWLNPVALDSGVLLSMGGLGIEMVDGVLAVRQAGRLSRASAPLKPGAWQHVAVSLAGGKLSFYVNGLPAGEVQVALADAAGDAVMGAGFKGGLDSVTLAKGARSAAYIKAAALSQTADSVMMSAADDGEAEGGVSYFAILLGAVTLDGWVVIGILGIMAVVSLYVMVTKTLALRRAENANAAFLDIFRDNSEVMLQPAHQVVKELKGMPSIQASSIYNLYTVGIREIAHRLDAKVAKGEPLVLTGAALESIRASLDATIVRAGQKFNSGIVLLTIAISGGPFLGLLGTVVGVMITFAAIAAAGDVNVNAIAPGIAAALVATVAGLAVAIPALFAYNWFAIKIKNISADTQVFADEFLTKSAELYTS